MRDPCIGLSQQSGKGPGPLTGLGGPPGQDLVATTTTALTHAVLLVRRRIEEYPVPLTGLFSQHSVFGFLQMSLPPKCVKAAAVHFQSAWSFVAHPPYQCLVYICAREKKAKGSVSNYFVATSI